MVDHVVRATPDVLLHSTLDALHLSVHSQSALAPVVTRPAVGGSGGLGAARGREAGRVELVKGAGDARAASGHPMPTAENGCRGRVGERDG